MVLEGDLFIEIQNLRQFLFICFVISYDVDDMT